MNKRGGEFHRWIANEWIKIDCPKVILLLKLEETSTYMKLWEYKCDKTLVMSDIGRTNES
jgi:hypothetical protein